MTRNIAEFQLKMFNYKIVTLKVQPLSLFHNKEKSHIIIIPK